MTFGLTLPDLDTGDKTLLASVFALVAAFSFGLSTVLSKRALKNVGFELGTYLRFLVTTLLMSVLVFGFGVFDTIQQINTKQWIVFLIIAFSSGGPAIFLYYYGLKRITASVSTICELSFPLTAVILEYLIRDNLLNIMQWTGVMILLIAIIKVSKLKQNQ